MGAAALDVEKGRKAMNIRRYMISLGRRKKKYKTVIFKCTLVFYLKL